MDDMYFKNINTGAILSKKEYNDLLYRESKGMWEELSEEEKREYNNDYKKFHEKTSELDTDFKTVKKDGSPYWD